MMGKTTRVFEHVGAMPAPTWHFLKMNDARIELPAALDAVPNVRVTAPANARGDSGCFDGALAQAQEAWEHDHPAPTPAEAAERRAWREAEADATYGGIALSGYQKRVEDLLEKRSLAADFAHGLGPEAPAYLNAIAGERIVLASAANQALEAQVVVTASAGAASAASVDVVAAPGSNVHVSLVVEDDGRRTPDAPGLAGTALRVFADARSQVSIARTQALGDAFLDLDDMALFASEEARIAVKQTVLGGSQTFTGLAIDLRGTGSSIDIAPRYLARDSQQRDFNYLMNHHGRDTRSELDAAGVLAGRSSKTLRATIDLIRGCKGAEGSERETTLLIDEGVHNRTVPVILCGEDDVAGNHGATIGHVRSEQLLYLASRGLDAEAAEHLFFSSMLEQAVIEAPDEQARAAALKLGERVSPGFAELLGEGA